MIVNKNFKTAKYKQDIYDSLPSNIDIQSVDELYSGIFSWISMFDFNIIVILIVVVFVAILNIIIAIIILVIEKSRLIGLMKIFGATQAKIQKIFLLVALNIIAKGLFVGNFLGLTILYIQHKFNFVKLDPSNYFVDSVPVEFSLPNIVFVNFLIIISSTFAFWIPMKIISRMETVKVLKIK